MNQTLTTLTDLGHSILYAEHSQGSQFLKSQSSPNPAHGYSAAHSDALSPTYSHYNNSFGSSTADMTNQFTAMESLSNMPTPVDSLIGPWESSHLSPVDPAKHRPFKSQQGSEFPVCLSVLLTFGAESLTAASELSFLTSKDVRSYHYSPLVYIESHGREAWFLYSISSSTVCKDSKTALAHLDCISMKLYHFPHACSLCILTTYRTVFHSSSYPAFYLSVYVFAIY